MSELMKQDDRLSIFNPAHLELMQRTCKSLAYSDLVPDMYKVSEKNPESRAVANCMIALDIASRIDANPLMVMQHLVVIYGKPSWSSKFLISTVNSCGRFNSLQFRFTNLGKIGNIAYTEYEKKWEDGKNGSKGYYKNIPKTITFDGSDLDNIECVCFTTNKGGKDILESSPVSIKMAIEEGWFTKSGSKWKTMPRQMLMYRAASFWTSTFAPELSMGMKTEEEVRDIEDVPYEDVSNSVASEKRENMMKQDVVIPINFTEEPLGDPSEEPKPEPIPVSEPVSEPTDTLPFDQPEF